MSEVGSPAQSTGRQLGLEIRSQVDHATEISWGPFRYVPVSHKGLPVTGSLPKCHNQALSRPLQQEGEQTTRMAGRYTSKPRTWPNSGTPGKSAFCEIGATETGKGSMATLSI